MEILDVLNKYNIKATFFICGFWFKKNTEGVKYIYNRGHEIANHGNSHINQNEINAEKNKEEITTLHKKVKDALGITMDLFRAPYGDYNNTVIQSADELGYYSVQWSVDSHDWMNKGVDYEVNQVLNNKNLKNGAILLFHNDDTYTAKSLPIILDKLISDGYEMVPVSQLIYKDNYYIDNSGLQIPSN